MIIITSIDELLSRIAENNLGKERIAFQKESQMVPMEIINLIKRLHVGHEESNNLKIGTQFTFRQQQCIDLLLMGKTNKEIANQLNLSVRTIEKYIESIKTRLNVRTRLELVLKYYARVNAI